MNLSDSLSLVKKGYTVAQIKEISALSAESADIIELAKSATTYEDFTALLEVTREPEPAKADPVTPPADAPKSEETAPEEKKEEVDYKAENEKLRAQLAQAQKTNTQADLSGSAQDDHEERLKDLMRSCY